MRGIDLHNLTSEQKSKLEELKGKRYTKEQREYQNQLLARKKVIIDYVKKNNITEGVVSYNEIICEQKGTKGNK